MRVERGVRAGAVGALLGSLLVASPAGAECTRQTNAFPPFAAVAPTASQVVIGTVVEKLGSGPPFDAFRLEVDEVIRGDTVETVDILRMYSGLPLAGPSSCRGDAVIYARVGAVLALALDGRYRGHTGVNTVAWIEGRPGDLVVAETISRSEARRAAELPATSTTRVRTGPGDRQTEPPFWLFGTLAAAIGALAWRGRRRGIAEPLVPEDRLTGK